jgi:hypothetical protein
MKEEKRRGISFKRSNCIYINVSLLNIMGSNMALVTITSYKIYANRLEGKEMAEKKRREWKERKRTEIRF